MAFHQQLLLCCFLLTVSQAFVLDSHGSCRTRRRVQMMAASSNNKNKQPASKFAQPAFRQAAHDHEVPAFANNNKKPASQKKRADSKLGELHQQRVSTAGRVGTKRYVNPCKVFCGNLPFNVTSSDLKDWICTKMGLPATVLLNQIKIIQDWKTGKSKGYGFCVFTEPIYATVCIETLNGQVLNGRAISVNQGQKKPDPADLYIKKKKKAPVDAEEAAIQQGLEEAEAPSMDPEEAALLRRLDPDLVDDYFQKTAAAESSYNVDDELELEFGDDDDGVDGFWEGDDDDEIVVFEDNKPMNREQRRDAAKRQKRRKLPHKGFGPIPNDADDNPVAP